MTDTTAIPNVSMANTKKEMLEAYKAVKSRLKANEKQLLDAAKARKEMEKQLALATAEAQATQDPVQRLQDLRSAISSELVGLAERFETEIDTFKKLQAAVAQKQQELKSIYEVETAASDFAALIEAQQAKKNAFDEEMQTRRAEFDQEMNLAIEKWEKEKTLRQQSIKEKDEFLKKQRQREKEEYQYMFSREKEQRKNALEDELQALEKEIAQKRAEFEQEYQQRDTELNSREEAVAKREAEMAALQETVDTFPRELETKVKSAVDAAAERISSDYEKAQALLKAKHDGEKNVLSSKIESLENLVQTYQTQIAELSKRQEQAYEKVQDIANRAVAAAKREFISIPAAGVDKSEKQHG